MTALFQRRLPGRVARRSRVVPLLEPLGDPRFRRLWMAQVASELGDWTARLALATLIYARTDSALLTAAVFVASVAPRLGPGQWLSTYADRVSRRAVMVSSDLVRAVLFGVLALASGGTPHWWGPLPLWLVIALAGLAGLASEPFRAARAAAVMEVTPTATRPGAMTLTLLTEDAAVLLGYAAGGLVLTLMSPDVALGLNALTFLLSAVLLSGLPPLASLHRQRGRSGRDGRSAGQTLRSAARALNRDPVTQRTAVLILTGVPTAAAIVVLVVPEVIESIPHVRWASGALLGGMPAVTLLVTLLIGTEAAPRLLPRIGRLIALPALVAVLLFASGSMPLQLLGFLVVGAILAPLTPAFVLLGLRLPEDLRASCFSLVSGLVSAAQIVLTLAAAALAEVSTPVTAAAACCTIPLLVALAHLARPVRVP